MFFPFTSRGIDVAEVERLPKQQKVDNKVRIISSVLISFVNVDFLYTLIFLSYYRVLYTDIVHLRFMVVKGNIYFLCIF